MKSQHSSVRQRGVALVVALLFLLVVTVISVIAASNSAIGLKMSANLQDAYSSFQSAEAGVIAALSLAETDDDRDPFDKPVASLDIFDSTDYWRCDDADNPLRDLNDGACSVTTDVFVTLPDAVCPSGEENLLGLGNKGGSNFCTFTCDYYLIESEHGVPRKARTMVAMGVVKTFPAPSSKCP